jgi:hypothetical protein
MDGGRLCYFETKIENRPRICVQSMHTSPKDITKSVTYQPSNKLKNLRRTSRLRSSVIKSSQWRADRKFVGLADVEGKDKSENQSTQRLRRAAPSPFALLLADSFV